MDRYEIKSCSITDHSLLVDAETMGNKLSLQMPTNRAEYIRKCVNNFSVVPEVVIEITGGVAEVTTKSTGVQVTIKDHDNKTETEDYSEEIWDESDEV